MEKKLIKLKTEISFNRSKYIKILSCIENANINNQYKLHVHTQARIQGGGGHDKK